MRGALTLSALALAAAFAAPAVGALELDVVPAWQGWSRPGRTTELELRVSGGGDALISITADRQRTTTTLTLEPGRPVRLRLPVAAASVVQAAVTGPSGGAASESVPIALAEAPLLAIVTATVGGPAPPGFQSIVLRAGDLPTSAAAYGSIDALAIDAAELAALDAAQWTALLGHVGSCGRTVLFGATDEAARQYATAAGCGGQAFAVAATADEVPDVLGRLLQRTVSTPPPASSLVAMVANDLGHWQAVVGVLIAAAALLMLGAVFLPSLAALVLLAAAATVGGAWLVQSRAAEAQLVVWAEAGAGDRYAQYRALHLSTLASRGNTSVQIPTELANPRPCRELQGAAWRWSVEERRHVALDVPGRLFERVSLCFGGNFPVARAAHWREVGDDRIAVRNDGASAWPAGALAWHGGVVPLPAVAPGAEFLAAPADSASPVSAAARQALARTPTDAVTVLWPLDLALLQRAPGRAQGWLLFTAASAADEGGP